MTTEERLRMDDQDQMLSFAPVPIMVQTDAMMLNGNPCVIVKWKTPDNLNVSYWEPGQLEKVADQFKEIAVKARTGLILPSGNGVTDLGSFRDQAGNVDEVDVPSGPDVVE
jgi:hypothetical protein